MHPRSPRLLTLARHGIFRHSNRRILEPRPACNRGLRWRGQSANQKGETNPVEACRVKATRDQMDEQAQTRCRRLAGLESNELCGNPPVSPGPLVVSGRGKCREKFCSPSEGGVSQEITRASVDWDDFPAGWRTPWQARHQTTSPRTSALIVARRSRPSINKSKALALGCACITQKGHARV
jgi:hypothetical protein